MGDVLVKGAEVANGRVSRLRVAIDRLPPRVIDRDTAMSWLRDGHSLVPWVDGRGTALQLVEVGDDDQPFIRMDNEPVAEDSLPTLPGV
jgi:hypothetical protein